MSDSDKNTNERVKITDIQGTAFLCVASFCMFFFFSFRAVSHSPGEPLFFALIPIILPFLLIFVVSWLASKVLCQSLLYIKYKEEEKSND